MKRLFLDSSTKLLYIAISEDEKLLDYTIRLSRNDHSKYLVDRIYMLLKRNNLTIDDIKEIIVGYGPGSYTGLRVSVMVSKMLAYTKKIKLSSVSSLYFLASGYNFKKAPMIDARNNNVFCAIYDNENIILEDGLRDTLTLRKIAKKHNAKPILLNDENYEVSISAILMKKEEVKDIHRFVPKYLRKTQAERDL